MGRLLLDSSPTSAERPASLASSFPCRTCPTAHFRSLLSWWTTRLNVVYSYATDPTNFSNDGLHDVAAQAAWFFTLERMMADAGVMLAAVDAPAILRYAAASIYSIRQTAC